MNEEQVCGVRRRRSRQEVEQVVAEYESSGLSRIEFCRERGVALRTLGRSEERRVGEGCRSRWSPYYLKKKANDVKSFIFMVPTTYRPLHFRSVAPGNFRKKPMAIPLVDLRLCFFKQKTAYEIHR